MPDLLFGSVPHDEAVAFLKDKPVVSRTVFDQMVPEIKARTFAVAGIESVKVLQSLRDRIADLPAGADWDDIKGDLVDQLSPYFESSDAEGADVSPAERRAETLLRTHGYQAYSAAQYNVLDRQRDVFPFWRYQTAQDDRVRDAHAALDGVVLPSNDPFWQSHFPPWDFNCRCTIVPLSPEDVEDIKAEDDKKPPEERSILTDDQRSMMKNSGILMRGPSINVDVRSPLEKGRADGYSFQPGDLRLSVAEIKSRYEAPVWSAFETFAKNTALADGRSVYDWMDGKAAVPGAETAALVPAPAAPENQKPVSSALQVLTRGVAKVATVRALQLIDLAHDDGVLPSIPVNGAVPKSAWGAYFRTAAGKPVNIALAAKAPQKLMTMTHEVGHFIDHQALDAAGIFASQESPLLAGWRHAVEHSQPIALLRQKLAAAHEPLRTHLEYLLRGREIWARAYAQYIATRTGDAAMLAELEAMRSQAGYGNLVTWTEADFAPIAKEIDLVFKQKGWIA
ncbi:MAG TPA: phage minor head protein [Rariglobus sp.]|jgi:SPP1 gp7 family putative phage head morphogenesis protein|nr:phage minor head protein [Rariglobus sp.]